MESYESFFGSVFFTPCIIILLTTVVSYLYKGNKKQEYIPGVPIAGIEGNVTLAEAREEFRRNAKEVLLRGYAKYKGRPFYIPSPLGERLMIPPQYVEELKSAAVEDCDFVGTFFEMFEGRYTTMGDRSTLHPRVAKTQLNMNINGILPSVGEEIEDSFLDVLPSSDEWIEVPIAERFVTIVARVSSRMFGGLELSRHPEWIASTIHFAEDGFVLAQKIKAIPKLLRPLVSRFLPELKKIARHHETARKVIIPILERRESLPKQEKRPEDFLQWMVDEAKGEEKEKNFISKIQLKLSFAAIHTSAAAPAQLLYDLCTHPEYIEILRSELHDVIGEKGEINKQSLVKLEKMDSIMKESQRFNPLLLVTFERIITKRTTLSDGFTIPKGTTVGVPAQAISMDPDIYPHPHQFDGLRFVKTHERVGTRDQYAASNLRSMAFGYGRHACPGRFFASHEIKMIMAYLLLNYDFRFPETKKERPQSIGVETQLLPNQNALICLRRRHKHIRVG
ncbi:putative cytochrome P450 [Annulohypoxylon truncatum]|uniref:putative cytochrome P450 n=1 Tax=Annulohypoxylon truncatum TaxID=327061 RepID=UPI002008900F|nr:putative cytochrome P450 [Annulohypoxylon truncatum]KAI1208440.1 putative cytochrome P450 [Annulohypoxylon truncatum]